MSTISDVSDVSSVNSSRWTENARGAGRDKGWHPTAVKVYNRIHLLIVSQRYEPDPTDEDLKQFEERLRNKFIGIAQREDGENEDSDEEPIATYDADEYAAFKRRRTAATAPATDAVPV